MKQLWTILAVAGCGLALLAQTNSPVSPKTERETHILSDLLEFELESLNAVYTGNVKVYDPQMQLTCELLTARFRTNNGQVEVTGIIAETNVVIDAVDWEGRTNHATADKLVYSYSVVDGITNQTLELSGNAWLTNYTLKAGMSAEPIIVDLVKSKVSAGRPKMTIQSGGVKSFGEEFERKKKQPAAPATTPETPK